MKIKFPVLLTDHGYDGISIELNEKQSDAMQKLLFRYWYNTRQAGHPIEISIELDLPDLDIKDFSCPRCKTSILKE